MNTFVRWLLGGAVMLGGVALLGCRTAPIERVVPGSLHPSLGGAASEEIDEAIWRAGRKLGWEMEPVARGVRGTLRVKRHVAVVRIEHAGGRFAIRFDSSVNLAEDGDRIHRHYNAWVHALAEQIAREASPAP